MNSIIWFILLMILFICLGVTSFVPIPINTYFIFYPLSCWLSIYESVVWALVGPITALVAIILLVFFLAIKASITVSKNKAVAHTKSISDTKTIRLVLYSFISCE